MKSDNFNKSEQIVRLRSKIMAAENSRLSGEPTVSLEEARTRLNEKYNDKMLNGNRWNRIEITWRITDSSLYFYHLQVSYPSL